LTTFIDHRSKWAHLKQPQP